jgi:hypothetical protein
MAEHDDLVRFRRKLRRKAVWVLVNAEHPECPESVEVYLPYQVPGQAAPLLILWRSEAGVWLVDKDIGPVEGPAPLYTRGHMPSFQPTDTGREDHPTAQLAVRRYVLYLQSIDLRC